MRFLMLVLAVCVAVSGQPDEFDDQEFEFDIPEGVCGSQGAQLTKR